MSEGADSNTTGGGVAESEPMSLSGTWGGSSTRGSWRGGTGVAIVTGALATDAGAAGDFAVGAAAGVTGFVAGRGLAQAESTSAAHNKDNRVRQRVLARATNTGDMQLTEKRFSRPAAW
jgi:hypothetical protein